MPSVDESDLAWADFQVALSFPEERRDLVEQVDARLAAALGPRRVFYYRRYLPGLALPNLNLVLRHIYHDRSQLVVAFLDQHYGVKRWCGIEWRAIRALIDSEHWNRVMLIALSERFDELGIYATDGCFDARSLGPQAIADAILERMRLSAETGTAFPAPPRNDLATPGLLRLGLDHAAPRLHRALTKLRWLPDPEERRRIEHGLAQLAANIRHDVSSKNYLPLHARTVDQEEAEDDVRNPFAQLVHLNIREVVGIDQGGDSASAQIAAVNRQSRVVKEIEKTLRRSREPLVLLGDPGSGKTMTLQKTTLSLVRAERRRVFPRVILYVRLGEFHLASRAPNLEDVRRLVRKACPLSVRPWLQSLEEEGRLVVLFDGMDEMSRDGYNDHTAALSRYAMMLEEQGGKCLFTCRITDFSPELRHARLVLLPFHRAQIARYLRLSFRTRTVVIDGRPWPVPRLARRLAKGELPVDASNPFILSLLCGFFRGKETLPTSRVELLEERFKDTYARKEKEAAEEGVPLPRAGEALSAWSRFAWIITESNRGTAVPVELLQEGEDPESVEEMIRAGTWCGVLGESIEQAQHLIRFEHHRFQEYFAARWAHDNQPAIDWLQKLDAPRWQETLLNLVLLGGAEDGVDALASSIAAEVEALREAFLRREAWQAEQEAKKQEEEKKKKEQAPAPAKQDTPGETEAPKADETAAGETTTPDEPEAVEPSEAPEEPAAPEEPPLPSYQAEALLADRVELGARLIPQGKAVSDAVEARLRPRLREAVGFLIENGTPITQVKMMRACQDLDDVDLLDALEKPLRSPVRWVSNQAVILVAARPGRRSDLPTEMGMDLATHSFLARWPVFFRGARENGEMRSKLALLFATVLGLAHAAILFAGALGLVCATLPLVRFIAEDVQVTGLDNFQIVHFLMLQGVVTAPALIFALVRHSAKAWLWMWGSVAAALPLMGLTLGLWEGNWESFTFPFGGLFLLLLTPVVALGSSLFHMLVLVTYSMLTRPLRRSDSSAISFLRVAWHDCGYANSVEHLRLLLICIPVLLILGAAFGLVGSLIGILLGMLSWLWEALGLSDLLSRLTQWFWRWTYALYVEQVGEESEVGFIFLILAVVYLVFRTLKGPKNVRLPWRPLLGFLKGLAHVAVVVAIFYGLAGMLRLIPEKSLSFTLDALGWGIGFLPKVLILVLLTGALFAFGKVFAWEVRNVLRTTRSFAPRSIQPEVWKARMEAAGSREQQNLLLRTTHQSLGLTPEAFLSLLEEAKAWVKAEPALSVYWERRDRLEQALRQERRG